MSSIRAFNHLTFREHVPLPISPTYTCVLPSQVAALWKDAPENPKRGQETTSRPKKKSTGDKENAASKPKSKPKKKAVVVEQSDEEGGEPDSDE